MARPRSFKQCGNQHFAKRHISLSDAELATFRSKLCEAHQSGRCKDSDGCPDSHCLTWQRRNPFETPYAPKLCPDIQFVKKGPKMSLIRRCNRGRMCMYAHSKEEELYHPLMYKTKMCSAHPSCDRCHCPFAHSFEELRTPFSNALVKSLWGPGVRNSVSESIAHPAIPLTSDDGSVDEEKDCAANTCNNISASSKCAVPKPTAPFSLTGVPPPPADVAANSSIALDIPTYTLPACQPPPPPPTTVASVNSENQHPTTPFDSLRNHLPSVVADRQDSVERLCWNRVGSSGLQINGASIHLPAHKLPTSAEHSPSHFLNSRSGTKKCDTDEHRYAQTTDRSQRNKGSKMNEDSVSENPFADGALLKQASGESMSCSIASRELFNLERAKASLTDDQFKIVMQLSVELARCFTSGSVSTADNNVEHENWNPPNTSDKLRLPRLCSSESPHLRLRGYPGTPPGMVPLPPRANGGNQQYHNTATTPSDSKTSLMTPTTSFLIATNIAGQRQPSSMLSQCEQKLATYLQDKYSYVDPSPATTRAPTPSMQFSASEEDISPDNMQQSGLMLNDTIFLRNGNSYDSLPSCWNTPIGSPPAVNDFLTLREELKVNDGRTHFGSYHPSYLSPSESMKACDTTNSSRASTPLASPLEACRPSYPVYSKQSSLPSCFENGIRDDGICASSHFFPPANHISPSIRSSLSPSCSSGTHDQQLPGAPFSIGPGLVRYPGDKMADRPSYDEEAAAGSNFPATKCSRMPAQFTYQPLLEASCSTQDAPLIQHSAQENHNVVDGIPDSSFFSVSPRLQQATAAKDTFLTLRFGTLETGRNTADCSNLVEVEPKYLACDDHDYDCLWDEIRLQGSPLCFP